MHSNQGRRRGKMKEGRVLSNGRRKAEEVKVALAQASLQNRSWGGKERGKVPTSIVLLHQLGRREREPVLAISTVPPPHLGSSTMGELGYQWEKVKFKQLQLFKFSKYILIGESEVDCDLTWNGERMVRRLEEIIDLNTGE